MPPTTPAPPARASRGDGRGGGGSAAIGAFEYLGRTECSERPRPRDWGRCFGAPSVPRASKEEGRKGGRGWGGGWGGGDTPGMAPVAGHPGVVTGPASRRPGGVRQPGPAHAPVADSHRQGADKCADSYRDVPSRARTYRDVRGLFTGTCADSYRDVRGLLQGRAVTCADSQGRARTLTGTCADSLRDVRGLSQGRARTLTGTCAGTCAECRTDSYRDVRVALTVAGVFPAPALARSRSPDRRRPPPPFREAEPAL